MKEGRGLHNKIKSEKTRARIEEFIKNNPGALKRDVCIEIGVTYLTLRKHLIALGKQ